MANSCVASLPIMIAPACGAGGARSWRRASARNRAAACECAVVRMPAVSIDVLVARSECRAADRDSCRARSRASAAAGFGERRLGRVSRKLLSVPIQRFDAREARRASARPARAAGGDAPRRLGDGRHLSRGHRRPRRSAGRDVRARRPARCAPRCRERSGAQKATIMTKVILVVDDDDLVRETTVDLVQDLGYQARAAANAKEALRLVLTDGIDAVLTDVMMPGMNGFELAERIGRRSPICR